MTLAATLIVGVIGAGISLYSSQQQAKAQSRIANLNFQAQMQAGNQQLELAKLQYDTNQKIYEQQAASGRNNALAMKAQADSTDVNARMDATRTRDDFERMKAVQRARLAKGGVLEAGTPLDMLAETAGQMELAVANQTYESGLESAGQRFQADVENQNASLTEFGGALQGFKDQAAMAGARNAMVGANIERLVGMNAARQTRQAGYASAFQSGAGLINSASNMRYQGVR